MLYSFASLAAARRSESSWRAASPPIPRLERAGKADDDRTAIHALDFAEQDTAFLAEACVGQFLVVVAAQPPGVETA